jgi:hypothetical protein
MGLYSFRYIIQETALAGGQPSIFVLFFEGSQEINRVVRIPSING